MKQIEEQHINQAIDIANSLNEEEITELVNRFNKAQPALFVYLLAVCEDEMEDEEIETLFFTGVLIWYATEIAEIHVATVSETTLEEIDSQNVDLIATMTSDTEDEEIFIDFEHMVQNHTQPHLMEYALLMSIEDETLNHESRGLFFVCLKTFIECLDKQGNQSMA